MMIIELRDKGGKKIKMRKNKIFVSLIMNFIILIILIFYDYSIFMKFFYAKIKNLFYVYVK